MLNPSEASANQRVSSSGPNGWKSNVPWILGALCAAAMLAGCEPVQSLNPFYEDKDVVCDSSLAGLWRINGHGESEKMALSLAQSVTDADAYDVALSINSDEPDEDEPQEGSVTFTGHLFQSGDARFLDLLPVKYTAKMGLRTISFNAADNLFGVPTHTVYLVTQEGNKLRLAFLDDDYVKAFVEKNDLPLTVRGSKNFVLTGKTEDLKAGLLIGAEREGLLDHDGIELTRQE
jgi:hypothetical protein